MTHCSRVLILGATGQVGAELQRSFSGIAEIFPADRRSVDLTEPNQMRKLIRGIQPDLILNAAAYTAVDRAESEAALAHTINAVAPGVLAEEAKRLGALLVHYSTDYVFDGRKHDPWTEEDSPNPINTYGSSKLAGEQAIREVGGKYLIFRTSWVYGSRGHNFLLTMLRLGKERERLDIVTDQWGAPTTSAELANATCAIIQGILSGRCGESDQWEGVYHMTCSGATSWFGFAERIFERAGNLLDGKRPQVNGIPSSEYPTPAKRPTNSVLSNALLEAKFGYRLPAWQAALDDVLAELIAHKAGHPSHVA